MFALRNYCCDKFELEFKPFLIVSLCPLTTREVSKYGADFKVSYSSNSRRNAKLGLIQFIHTQTSMSNHCAGQFNLDTNKPIRRAIDCLYGDPTKAIQFGEYENHPMSCWEKNACYLINSSRVITPHQNDTLAKTCTCFSNFVAEIIDEDDIRIFPQGISWNYEYYQDTQQNFSLLSFKEPIAINIHHNPQSGSYTGLLDSLGISGISILED